MVTTSTIAKGELILVTCMIYYTFALVHQSNACNGEVFTSIHVSGAFVHFDIAACLKPCNPRFVVGVAKLFVRMWPGLVGVEV